MKRKIRLACSLTITAAVVAACSTPDRHQQSGTVMGGLAGGVLGSQIGHGGGRAAATILGAVAGGLVGNTIGASMDTMDRTRTAQVLEATPTGTITQWRNPDTGREYAVVPTRTYASAAGPCREYTMDVNIGGRSEKAYGTACRQPDGSWRAQN